MYNIQTKTPAETINSIRQHCKIPLNLNGLVLPRYRLDMLCRYMRDMLLRIVKVGGLVFVFLFPLLCRAENASPLLSPLVAIKGAGEDYLPNLEKMEKYLKESNLLEFYLEAERFTKKIEFTRHERRIGTYTLNGKEEHIACEWFSYYVAKAPLFPDEWVMSKGSDQRTDIQMKEFALECILDGDMQRRAELLSVNKQKLRTLYLNYAKVIFKAFNLECIKLDKLRKRDWNLFLEEKKTWKEEGYMDEKEVWRRKGITGTASVFSYIRKARIQQSRRSIERMQDNLLRRLMEENTRNGPRIHAYFFEIGYSKEDLAKMLRKEARSSKTVRDAKYLFDGLPKPKD